VNDRPRTFLERLGLHRPELRAWAMYDWANSTFVTTIVTAVFPIYFAKVAAKPLGPEKATTVFLASTTVGMVVSAVVSPYLGALADCTGRTKRLLGASLAVALVATAAMFFVGEGAWVLGAVLFAVSNIAATATFVFYDSLLPHVASDDEVDRVSSAGYALGYVGGGVLLALNLAWMARPAWFGIPAGDDTLPVRLAFLSVAVWWLVFSIPLFKTVPDTKPVPRKGGRSLWIEAFAQLRGTYSDLKRHPQAFLMLAAFLLFNDGIGTVIRVAAIYGTEKNLPDEDLIAAILLVQFVGIPFSFAFGSLAGRIGAKRSVLLGVGVYFLIAALAFFMETTAHFYALALLVAMVQGGTQALSRSLFASLIPKHKTAEFFGFFGTAEKFAGIIGPPLFGLVAALCGASRWGVLTVVPFFGVGAWLLAKVDVEKGRAQARAATSESAVPAPA
jgi:UMF1 family MFS transporter